MRGQRYSPIENMHFIYQNHSDSVPWYKYNFAIRTLRNNEPIGFIGFYQLSQPDSVMLSYGLSKTYWGLGIMSEALAVCIPWFVTSQTVRELVAFAVQSLSYKSLIPVPINWYGNLRDTCKISNSLESLVDLALSKWSARI